MTTKINPATGLAEDTFAIARLLGPHGVLNALVLPGGAVVDITPTFPDANAIYDDWLRNFATLTGLAKDRPTGLAFGEYTALSPTVRPQIFCAGSNYRQHAAEMYTFNEGNYQKERLADESDDDFFKRNLAFVNDKRGQVRWGGVRGLILRLGMSVRL